MRKSGNAFANTETVSYSYNSRSELISAQSNGDEAYKYMYTFDNIGNRISDSERSVSKFYETNSLNQYTSIDSDFVSTFDMDGNQTKVKTSTGIWEVTYNAENRPVKFRNDNFFIVMNYDYQGRRIQKTVYENDVITADEKFMYNGYRLIQRIKNEHLVQSYAWDLNDNLRFVVNDSHIYSVLHDANRNVTQLMADSVMMIAHYEYSPFGAVTVSSGPLASMNPFRFSSEYHDDELGLVYYNYRHYNALDGRWINRDPIAEDGGWNLYSFIVNNMINFYDYLGLASNPESGEFEDGNEITWDDFTGTPPEDSNYDAKISYSYSFHPIGYNYDCKKLDAPQKTSTGKEICFSCTVKYKDYKIKYKMDKKNSYVKNKDPALLRHEIVHYQILKSFAKTWTSKFKALEGSGSGCKENDAKIAAVKVLKNNTTEKQKEFTDAFNKEEKNYDQETNHGLNSNEQKKWEDKYL